MPKRKKNNKFKLYLLVILLAVLLVVAGFAWNKRSNKKVVSTQQVQTTSNAPSAQQDFTSNSDRQISTTPENKGSGGVSDTQGQQATPTDSSTWSKSASGEITAYTPVKNQLLQKGDVISGESTLSVVNYRLIDNVSGMIAQGQLTVTNGKFSGTISFSTTASTGRLDIYGTTDSGKEFGNVEIPIRFK